MSDTVEFDHIVNTIGNGYWSDIAKPVILTHLTLTVMEHEDDGRQWGELRIFFNKVSWNRYQDGLIYTDSLFIKEVRKLLSEMGLDGSDVDYSEQGMQGDDYVSCDVGEQFIHSWLVTVGPVEIVVL